MSSLEVIKYSDTVAQAHCIIALVAAVSAGIWHFSTRPLYGFWSWEGWSVMVGAAVWFLIMCIGFELIGPYEEETKEGEE